MFVLILHCFQSWKSGRGYLIACRDCQGLACRSSRHRRQTETVAAPFSPKKGCQKACSESEVMVITQYVFLVGVDWDAGEGFPASCFRDLWSWRLVENKTIGFFRHLRPIKFVFSSKKNRKVSVRTNFKNGKLYNISLMDETKTIDLEKFEFQC